MNLQFKSLSTRKDIDLVPYIKDFLSKNENTTIFIGSDSQNRKDKTTYAAVIVLHNSGKGGHVIYAKDILPRIQDRFTRLWNEVEYSIVIAEYLTQNGIQKPNFIDIDLNPDPKYKSNQVLRSALGYVESMGYTPRCKPNAMVASYVADALCK
jgi:predicted RNase H-related nuclease YkuK (DUF458 family)